jgi:hypothetical protein
MTMIVLTATTEWQSTIITQESAVWTDELGVIEFSTGSSTPSSDDGNFSAIPTGIMNKHFFKESTQLWYRRRKGTSLLKIDDQISDGSGQSDVVPNPVVFGAFSPIFSHGSDITTIRNVVGSYFGSGSNAGCRIIVVVSLQIVVAGDPATFQMTNPLNANFTNNNQAELIGSNIKRASDSALVDGEVFTLTSVNGAGVQVQLSTTIPDTYNMTFSYMYGKQS